MTVSIPVNKPWHEECLIILELAKSALTRKELKSHIEKLQEQRIPSPLPPHTDSTYSYWINRLKEWRIVQESSGVLKLSGIGKWLANSRLGHIEIRLQFIYLVLCPKCIDKGKLTCMTPQDNSPETNHQGISFMNFQCTVCNNIQHGNIRHVFNTVPEFLAFYKKAIPELMSFIAESK